MKIFKISTPEGIDLILWCSLRTMFEANAEDDLWKNQEEWILKSWNFYDNCGVHILVLEDGTEFYMLVEKRYPLTKETLERMLALRLIVESESEAVFDLLRFIQQQIDESGSHDGTLAIPEQTATGKEISNPFMAVSLDLSRLATTLNRLERSIQTGIYNVYVWGRARSGGNKWIGLEICRQLALIGVEVVLTSRNESLGVEAIEKLNILVVVPLNSRAMIELWADEELKDTIVVAVEYEWKPPRCSYCKVFGHTHEECPKNIGVGVTKNLKKPSQTSRGVPVGPKVGFKLTKNIDLFLKRLLLTLALFFMDDAGNPLKKVEYSCDHDSEDKVASVDNDMARSIASERVGFGTQSLLKQWRDSYGNGDYDDDPYDDDMYKGQDLPKELQTICDNLDIRVRGRKRNKFLFLLSGHFVYIPFRK
ncbi:hypothetical protein Tco_1051890 [Tanacetum coccineum]